MIDERLGSLPLKDAHQSYIWQISLGALAHSLMGGLDLPSTPGPDAPRGESLKDASELEEAS